MKRKMKIAAVLVGLMMFAGVGSAFADKAAPSPSASGTEAAAKHAKLKLEALKEFQDELHQLNQLRLERFDLKTKIVQRQDKLIDLTVAAKENGGKEALKQAAEIRKQVHVVNADIRTLHKNIHDELKAFRQAEKDGNRDLAQSHINRAIEMAGQLNGKLGQKVNLLNQIIAVLS